MEGKKFIIGVITLCMLSFVSMKSTMAFFAENEESTANVFQAAAVFASPTPTVTPTPEPSATPTATPEPTITPTPTNTPTPTPVQHLVISEVLIDPSEEQQIAGDGGASRGEFVEIHNPTSVPVDLATWHIFDGSGQEDFSGILPAGGFLIVTGATESEFRAVWDNISAVPSGTLFHTVADGKIFEGLSSGGGTVYLRLVFPSIDSLSWGSNTAGFSSGCPFGFCPTPNIGSSLGRLPINQDTDSANDFVINNPPNPGS